MRFAALAFALVLASCASTPPGASVPPAYGVQLFHLRADMAEAPLETLQRAAQLGVAEVEYFGSFSVPASRLCAETQKLGLGVAAAHADWQQLKSDPEAAIAHAKALCADTIMLAWLPPAERQSAAQWRWWVDHLNHVNRLARAEGLALAYHAHDFEFQAVEGVRPIDLLMDGMDADIGFELDTYWVAKAGVDPLQFLKDHRDRITHLHLKDMAGDGSMADVGTGTLPMGRIIAQARAQGVEHFVIERDDAPDPWESLATSLDSLRAMPLQR